MLLNESSLDIFTSFAENVWEIKTKDPFKMANESIEKTAQFFHSLGIPSTLRELNIDEKIFDEVSEKVSRNKRIGSLYKFSKKEIVDLLETCSNE